MGNGHVFRFKQFSVAQDCCSHKVGTDGVLLGAWVKVEGVKNVLDIGTGTGVIALMVAQRTPSQTVIDALEIAKEDAEQARYNCLQSPWSDRIQVHQVALQDFHTDKKYDLLVSNPPFFSNSLLSPHSGRTLARHTESLSFRQLLEAATCLLTSSGRLSVILPYVEGLAFTELAMEYHFHCVRKWTFQTRSHKKPERLLLDFSHIKQETEIGELTLYDSNNQWSEEYRLLTRDFYLYA